jgi:predicted metalloprotease with PDZ domain
VRDDGAIVDAVEGMSGARAGIGPGMKVIAVNGRRFTFHVLREALQAGKDSSKPLELLVQNTDYYKTYQLDYHGGEQYPHLVRDQSKPDMLSEIVKAH